MVCLCLGKNRGKVQFSEPAGVLVQYWASDRRRRDVPGLADALCHILERAAIVVDDSLLVNWTWEYMGLDREHPRAKITITDLEAAP